MATMKTPKGKLMWAKVVTPDTKWNPAGEYSCEILLKADDPATQEMCETLEKLVQEAVDKEMELKPERFKSLPNKQPLTAFPWQEAEGGMLKFKAKLKAQLTTKNGDTFSQRPVVVDSKGVSILRVAEDGRVMNNSFSIGNGSVGVVHFQPTPYYIATSKTCGVSMRLKAVQVMKLEKYGNNGFDFEEADGFEYEDEYGNEKATSAQSAGDEDGDF